APMGLPVDPEILIEAPVLLLRAGQIDEGAERDLRIAGRKQSGGAVAHVPCPDQMVAPHVLVGHGFAPRDAERCDQGSVISLVFMRQDYRVAGAVEVAAMTRRLVLPRQQM